MHGGMGRTLAFVPQQQQPRKEKQTSQNTAKAATAISKASLHHTFKKCAKFPGLFTW